MISALATNLKKMTEGEGNKKNGGEGSGLQKLGVIPNFAGRGPVKTCSTVDFPTSFLSRLLVLPVTRTKYRVTTVCSSVLKSEKNRSETTSAKMEATVKSAERMTKRNGKVWR